MKTRTSKYISTAQGTYERAAETKDNIYYISYTETEDSAKVLMYDRHLQLQRNDRMAFASLEADRNNFTWVSKKYKESLVRRK